MKSESGVASTFFFLGAIAGRIAADMTNGSIHYNLPVAPDANGQAGASHPRARQRISKWPLRYLFEAPANDGFTSFSP